MYKGDYEIRISADITDNIMWRLYHKGYPILANDKGLRLVREECQEVINLINKMLNEEV